MISVPVATPSRSYEVLIGSALLSRAGDYFGKILENRRAFVVTVPPVRRRWARVLMKSLSASGIETALLEMPDGERSKRLATLEKLAEKLIKQGADRGITLIALGGGVVCDVTGFLASIYMRGVDVIQIPTTVLAQVDAAVGGKTGVNLVAGKNLLGSFHQPLAVLIDPDVLRTLPEREYRAGLYEIVKCGVIRDAELFRVLDDCAPAVLAREPATLDRIIAAAVRIKAEVVSADEREGDLRRILNFGHTIGHALEAETEYSRFLHGEAVAFGMRAATALAERTGDLASGDRALIDRVIARYG